MPSIVRGSGRCLKISFFRSVSEAAAEVSVERSSLAFAPKRIPRKSPVKSTSGGKRRRVMKPTTNCVGSIASRTAGISASPRIPMPYTKRAASTRETIPMTRRYLLRIGTPWPHAGHGNGKSKSARRHEISAPHEGQLTGNAARIRVIFRGNMIEERLCYPRHCSLGNGTLAGVSNRFNPKDHLSRGCSSGRVAPGGASPPAAQAPLPFGCLWRRGRVGKPGDRTRGARLK